MELKNTNEMLAKYFSGNCNTTEKTAVKNWAAESAENKQVFDNYNALWRNAHITSTYRPNVEAALARANNKLEFVLEQESSKKTFVTRSLKWALSVAATLLIIIAGYWFLKLQNYGIQPVNKIAIITSTNEKRNITLPDGTHVWLNKATRLEYPASFVSNERRVKLEGEAYFEVKKMKNKTFSIEAGNSLTTVLGTHFNVRARKLERTVVVSVLEGKVALSSAKTEVKLFAGDKGTFSEKAQNISKEKYSDSNLLAWQTGKLVFKNAPVCEVVKTIAEYYNVNVKCNLPKKSNITINTTFNNQSISEVFRIIELTLSLKVSSTKEGYMIDK